MRQWNTVSLSCLIFQDMISILVQIKDHMSNTTFFLVDPLSVKYWLNSKHIWSLQEGIYFCTFDQPLVLFPAAQEPRCTNYSAAALLFCLIQISTLQVYSILLSCKETCINYFMLIEYFVCLHTRQEKSHIDGQKSQI